MFDATPRPELLALLAAVKAEPDDDTTKLVLADWLEEQDLDADRARGEFVRTLVRYHRLDRDDPAYPDTHARLRALWQHYHPAWLGPLFTAGFTLWNYLHHWALPFPSIDGTQVVAKRVMDAAGSEAYAWVAGLYFGRVSGRQLERFARSPLLDSLAGLSIQDCNVNAGAIADVVYSPRAAGLRLLDLGRVGAPAGAIGASPHMSRLRVLKLDYARVHDAGFKELCDSPHLNELRSLTVANDAMTIHSARAFSDATGLPALTELNIGGTNRIGPDGTLILVHKPAAGRLRKLNLWSNGVADYGVEAICNQKHMCNLTHLDVSGNLLTNRAAVAIAATEHLKMLEELSLRTNGISGDGALALADSPHLANLRRLDLGGNNIGAKAASRLRERFGSRLVLE